MKKHLVVPHSSLPLTVEFDSVADRISHEIYLTGSTGNKKILSSLEGTSQEPWPQSPVLQQVEHCEFRQQAAGQPLTGLVGLGLAGTSHWSIAVEVGNGLEFDVACRVSEAPDFLGSTYQAHNPGQISSDGRQCRFDLGDGDSVIWELLEGQISGQDQQFVVLPAENDGPYPTTFRWRYRIRHR